MPARSLDPRHPCSIDVIEERGIVIMRARCRCGTDLGPALRISADVAPKVRDAAFRKCIAAIRAHERAVGVCIS